MTKTQICGIVALGGLVIEIIGMFLLVGFGIEWLGLAIVFCSMLFYVFVKD